MKIKLWLVSILLCSVTFLGINVQAEEVTWDTISNRYKELLESAGADGYKIQINPIEGTKDVQVSLDNPVYGKYFIQFKYDEAGKTITYTNNRNVEKASEQTQIYYRYTDEYFIKAMFYTLLDVYKIDDKQGVTVDIWEQYGVTDTKEEKNLTYKPDENTSFQEQPYKSVSFNLETFNTATLDKQNTLTSDSPYPSVLRELKTSLDPMGDCLKDFTPSKDEPEIVPTPEDPKNLQTNENPKTGLSLPIIGSITVLIVTIIAYFILNRKNLFKEV